MVPVCLYCPTLQPGRYWPEVSDAADTSVGGASVTLVVADKNLVPSPRGNLERAMRELSDSGALGAEGTWWWGTECRRQYKAVRGNHNCIHILLDWAQLKPLPAATAPNHASHLMHPTAATVAAAVV